MRVITIGAVITTVILSTLLIYFVARIRINPKKDVFMMFEAEDYEDSLEKTHATIGHRPYPKDLNATKNLLAEIIGRENVENGTLKYPSIFVKKYSRLGNNILQVSNSIYLAEVFNISTIYITMNLCFINNTITTSRGIQIIPVDKKPEKALSLKRSLFRLTYKGFYCPEDRVYEFAGETLKSIPKVKVDDNALYIHIRSGDIFKKNPNRHYGQPPLCFYEGIIRKWGFKKVYILTEDRKNPGIDKLVRRYGAKLIITDVFRAMGYVLNAKNLAISFGTFVPSLLKLVPEDPERRIFRYGNNFSYDRVLWNKFFYTEISENYWNGLLKGNWNNTDEQREMMLNETCGDEWKISLYTNYSF